ncbi:MAG: 1-acyl-sn-glycerol-3-phosphate acyltransferase [Ectothiorhodospiraceae bacterium]|nr:1-acyl-sn-glycerol-3-phosphate acyltransferase [Ectothiorhodospiraceae bacterium]
MVGWPTGVFLRRLGTEPVARADAVQGVEDVRHLVTAAAAGKSLLFFPEGTFTERPGLLPFHLGAFAVAAGARVPVVPVAVRGTRVVLRDGHWFPRRGSIDVVVCAQIPPQGACEDRFETAMRLRALARERILEECGDPDHHP